MALVAAVVLVSLGAVKNLAGHHVVTTLEGTTQVIPGGPVARQVVAKTLASNEGAFFNANSAPPLRQPQRAHQRRPALQGTGAAVLAALHVRRLVGDRRQGRVGKRIGPAKIKLTMLAVLIVPAVVLAVAGALVTLPALHDTTSQDGVQGLTEILHAAASATNGNDSAMTGLDATGTWWTTILGPTMLAGRFPVLVPVLALAGSLALQARADTSSSASLDTTSGTFTGLDLGVVVVVGGLMFLPALALIVFQAALG